MFLHHVAAFGEGAEDNLVIKQGLLKIIFFVIPDLIRDPDTRTD